MTFALDTSVLIDLLQADPVFGPRSREMVHAASMRGRVTICEVVWAETQALFEEPLELTAHLDDLGVEYSALQSAAASVAGRMWRDFRRSGSPRQRVIADFLVGAHALVQADALVTRDRGFYRTYFSGLQILDPAARLQ